MSALAEGTHPWRPGSAEPWVTLDWCDPHEGRLLVADSWRVIDGRARGLDEHRARFLAAAREHRDDVSTFWNDAITALPRQGDWFPRVELRARAAGTALSLRLRPTPALDVTSALSLTSALSPTSSPSTDVVVATAPHDPRTQPLVKGPDLDALQALRVSAQASGASEAIIVDAQGRVVEGAYSGLLWWRGETLVRPSDALPRIRSVTAELMITAARAAGVTVIEADARPDELAGCELWVLSALHGLRVATRWINGPELAPPRRATLGREWLEGAAHELYPVRGTPALGG